MNTNALWRCVSAAKTHSGHLFDTEQLRPRCQHKSSQYQSLYNQVCANQQKNRSNFKRLLKISGIQKAPCGVPGSNTRTPRTPKEPEGPLKVPGAAGGSGVSQKYPRVPKGSLGAPKGPFKSTFVIDLKHPRDINSSKVSRELNKCLGP